VKLPKNKKLALSVGLNVLLAAALSILLYLVYPQFLYRLDSVENFGRYSVRTYRNDKEKACFEVLWGPEEWEGRPHVSRRIYSCSGEVAFFVEALGADFTGAAVPGLVVQQWNGSASGHGSRYLVLELNGSTVKEIALIEGLAGVKREDVNKDGVDELVGYDEAYCFWGGYSRAGSPFPRVVLSFDKMQGRFVVNKELMAQPPLSQAELHKLSLEYKNDSWWAEWSAPPGALFGKVFDLIYGGNEKQAWELFDASWAEGSKCSRKEWKQEVQEALRRSPYSPMLWPTSPVAPL
jgi:hypothetical protein